MDHAACQAALQRYPFVEFRFDLLELRREDRKQLVRMAERSITTCRPGRHSEAERMEMLGDAIVAGGTYVDLEIDAGKRYRQTLIRLAREHGTRIIISYHHFERTPGQQELKDIIDQAADMNADIIKLACQVNTTEDAARLMGCYRDDLQLVSLGMGDKGLITRIAAPFLGAAFTFAAPEAGLETAPGQLSCTDLAYIIDRVKQANTHKNE